MKLSFIINLLVICSISANSYSQKGIFSLNLTDVSIKDVIKTIEASSNYRFFYNEELNDISKKVNILVKDQALSEILDKLLFDSGLSYRLLENNLIVITPQSILQQQKISGTVNDASTGEPIAGVNIIIQGTTLGTVTDTNGKFTLDVPNANAILLVSFIGYNTETVGINGQSNLSITLVPDITKLEEVVVVGYGTVKKSDLTGAITTIKGDELKAKPVSSFEQAVQGRMPGVLITQNSGEPGGAVSFKIRGIGSFGTSEPLYVIDGVIMNTSNESAGRTSWDGQAPNALSALNPSDIESIQVLKDAAATAIYGTRAGNGVVIISTKRGKEGKANLNFDAYYGLQTIDHYLDLMTASQFAQFSNESYANAGQPTSSLFSNPASLGKGTDWQKEIYRTAPIQNYQLSISGGTNKNQYYISGGYLNQDGIIKGSNFNRYSFRINSDNRITDKIKIGTNLTLSRTFHKTLPSDTYYNGISLMGIVRSPTLGVKNADGSWAGPTAADINYVGNVGNPVRMIEMSDMNLERLRAFGNVFLEVDLIKGLKFKSNLGTDYGLTNVNTFSPKFKEDALEGTVSNASQSKSTAVSVLFENTLTFNKVIADKHNIEILAGYTAQKYVNESVNVGSKNPLSDDLRTVNAGDADPATRIANGSRYDGAFLSALGRFNYSFNDRYLISASIRRDGSSNFTKKNRFGVFPAFSAGWKISEESFMKSITFIDLLKIRGSYGEVGIDAGSGGAYQYISSTSGYPLGGKILTGYALAGTPSVLNEDLKWETAKQTNIGLDLEILNNRVSMNFDYYYKNNTDMIVNENLPLFMGVLTNGWYESFSVQSVNSAEVLNKGIEMGLTYRGSSKDFTYDIGANITTIHNEITKLKKRIPSGSVDNIQTSLTMNEEGRSIGEFYGYVVEGIFQNQGEIDALKTGNVPYQPNAAPGDFKYKDVNGFDAGGMLTGSPDGKIDAADRTFLGKAFPTLIYGFNLNAGYKGFDLGMVFTGVSGNKIFNVNKLAAGVSGGASNKPADWANHWKGDGTSNKYPRAIATDPNNNKRASSFYVEDGSYFRLRNIQLGYAIPKVIINKINVNSLRIYVSAQNLFTVTKYSGYSPDLGSVNQNNGSTGIDMGTYPQSKTFMFGVTMGF